jgi:hypothetical protein
VSQSVEVPGVGTLQFPDGMSQPDMAAAIQKNFPQIHPPQTQAPEEKQPENTWTGAARGVADAGLAMASGFAKQVVGVPKDLAKLAEKISEPLSRETPQEKAQEAKLNAQPGITEKLQSLLDYQPKTEEGKQLLAHIQTVLTPVSEVGGAIHQGIADVAGEETANVLGDVAALSGGRAAGGVSRAAETISKATSTESKVLDLVRNLSGGRELGKGEVGKAVKGAVTSTEQAAKKAGDTAYDELSKAMPPTTSVDVAGSSKIASHHAAGLVVDPKVKAVSDKLNSVGSMTFDSLKTLRTQVSDLMGTDRNVNRQLRSIRDGITEDINKAAQKLSPQAKAAWDKANSQWVAYTKAQDEITRVFGRNWKAGTTTALYQKVLRAAKSDPDKVTTVLDSIKDPAVRRQFAASMIHHMADKEGEFNGDKLVREWGNMDPDARKAVFKSIGGDYEANMNRLITKLDRIREGHTGLIKEVSGVGVASLLAHLIPGGAKVVGGITLVREAYKFSPATVEKLLSSPRAVKEMLAMGVSGATKATGAAVVGTSRYQPGQMTLQNDK